jgi:hypothetical protein
LKLVLEHLLKQGSDNLRACYSDHGQMSSASLCGTVANLLSHAFVR